MKVLLLVKSEYVNWTEKGKNGKIDVDSEGWSKLNLNKASIAKKVGVYGSMSFVKPSFAVGVCLWQFAFA